MPGLIRRLLRDERGATSIEYGLIVAGIAITILGAVTLFGNTSTGVLNTAMSAISAALNGQQGAGAEA